MRLSPAEETWAFATHSFSAMAAASSCRWPKASGASIRLRSLISRSTCHSSGRIRSTETVNPYLRAAQRTRRAQNPGP